MSDEYVPTTNEVRDAWAGWTNAFSRGLGIGKDEFDRWLAARDAERVRELQDERDTWHERWRQLMRDHEAAVKERDELEAECLRVDEANTRLGERVRELQAENERLQTALRRKENHRARAREQVRQRDEAIERVRNLADEWERTYPSLMVGPFLRAVLDGDGEVKEENDE